MRTLPSSFIKVGEFTSTHGTQGALNFYLEQQEDRFNQQSVEFIFLRHSGSYVPYKILAFAHKKKSIYTLKIDTVHTIEKAETFVKKGVFLAQEFSTRSQVIQQKNSFTGFSVYNQDQTFLGYVLEHNNQVKHNPLILLETEDQTTYSYSYLFDYQYKYQEKESYTPSSFWLK